MKKLIRILLTMIAVLMVSTLPAHAMRGGHGHGHGGGHVSFGLFVGPEWWGPGWGGYPYYYPYYSPPVVIQQPPEIYVQPSPQAAEPQYWYFCKEANGYYPYVKRCPGGWMKVVPPANPPATPEGEE